MVEEGNEVDRRRFEFFLEVKVDYRLEILNVLS